MAAERFNPMRIPNILIALIFSVAACRVSGSTFPLTMLTNTVILQVGLGRSSKNQPGLHRLFYSRTSHPSSSQYVAEIEYGLPAISEHTAQASHPE